MPLTASELARYLLRPTRFCQPYHTRPFPWAYILGIYSSERRGACYRTLCRGNHQLYRFNPSIVSWVHMLSTVLGAGNDFWRRTASPIIANA